MKIRALKSFEGIRDNERSIEKGKDVFPKEGEIWETSEERANFLKEHGVVEFVEEEESTEVKENINDEKEDIQNEKKDTEVPTQPETTDDVVNGNEIVQDDLINNDDTFGDNQDGSNTLENTEGETEPKIELDDEKEDKKKKTSKK